MFRGSLPVGCGRPSTPLVVLLDEAHTVEPAVGRNFFNAVQNASSAGLPFFLIAAGTPDAPRKIRHAGTFAERAFDLQPIGRLGAAAAAEALTRPAEEAGRPIQADALELLIGESANYPYFIQLLGSGAWEAASKAEAPSINRRRRKPRLSPSGSPSSGSTWAASTKPGSTGSSTP